MTDIDELSSRISAKLEVKDLGKKLKLLLVNARNPRVTNVAALDRELGLSGDRSFRQYYRSDRPSGIPGPLIEKFLRAFDLAIEQLQMEFSEFKSFIESNMANEARQEGWYSAKFLSPKQLNPPGRPGDLRLAWENSGIVIDFASEIASLPILAGAPDLTLLNLRRATTLTSVRLNTKFRIELTLRERKFDRLMGLIEGNDVECFHKPFPLQPGPIKLRIPATGEPYHFDTQGLHTIWLIAFSDVRLSSADFKALESVDSRRRRAAAERIFDIATAHVPKSVAVFRAEFRVAP